MIAGVYYFDLGLLESDEAKFKKLKNKEYNKRANEKRKLALFGKIGKFAKPQLLCLTTAQLLNCIEPFFY